MGWVADVESYVNQRLAEVDAAGVAFSKNERAQLAAQFRRVAEIDSPAAQVGGIARLSDDRREGAGNLRQMTDVIDCALRHQLAIVELFIDTDRSASRFSTRTRERYVVARDMLLSGELDGLLAYHLDRLWREPAEAERILQRVLEERARCWSPSFVLNDGASVMFARLMIGLAANESEEISRRTRRAMETAATRGVPHGGVVPYGRQRVLDINGRPTGEWSINHAEAVVIQEVCRRALAGEPLSAIARDLNDRGVSTRRGGPWRHTTIRSVLSGAHVAGLRAWTPSKVVEHKRQARGPTSHIRSPHLEPIIDEVTWQAVCQLLEDPTRKTTAHRGGHERRWLGAGFLVCGACGGRLGSKSGRSKQGALIHTYACRDCKRVRRSAAVVDEYLAAGVIEWLGRTVRDTGRPSIASGAAAAQLAKTRSARERLLADYVDGSISGKAYEDLHNAIAAAEAKALADVQRTKVQQRSTLPNSRKELTTLWASASLADRRKLIADAEVEVVVFPVGKGRRHDRFAGLALRQRGLEQQ